ncbi:NmrA family NAD(P)-binding protein [Actinocorallia populi]|uniref:NmrA family NAD(P)-binding protein n=1 Tax=Actinocorallia populi TaxID=2079200 RepID=UPI000D093C91|nr:NmrA family NAD(P)-binding protein [Actinocorallia populi]
MTAKPILVIGSTGKTGGRVIARLTELGHAVRGVSRNTEIPFVWEKRETWPEALRGAGAVYVTYSPDLAAPGAPADIEAFVAAAAEAGVERLVLLSGRGEHNAIRCEEIVRDSGLPYTLLRASWFAQNFSEGAMLGQVLEGVVAMPAGEVAEPFIDLEDLADVAVAALTDDRHEGRLYELTGPRLLTFHEAAARIAEAAGRPVAYVPVTLDEFHAELSRQAGPEYAELLTELCREVFDGRNASLGDGVREALGREPRDFASFCRDVSAAWTLPS